MESFARVMVGGGLDVIGRVMMHAGLRLLHRLGRRVIEVVWVDFLLTVRLHRE